MAKSSGAYVDRADPSVVFVWSKGFSAIRVGGVWKPSELTIGDLDADFKPIDDKATASDLLITARTSLSDKPVRARNASHAP